jgi:hypothetical protein
VADEQVQEYYDDANEEFPGKEDLKDRLVAIWVTGKKGTRRNADGGTYPWVETITLVMDDGPDGTFSTPLVGPAPERLDKFQYSQGGLVSRLEPRISKKDGDGNLIFRPMIGRINSRKNKIKGRSDSWSIAAPNEDDKAMIDSEFAELIKEITAEVRELRTAADDSDENQAFD